MERFCYLHHREQNKSNRRTSNGNASVFDAKQLKLSRKVLLLVSIPLTFELIFLALLLAMSIDLKDEIAREKEAHLIVADVNRVLSNSEHATLLCLKSIEFRSDDYYLEFLLVYPRQQKHFQRLKELLQDNHEDSVTVDRMSDAFFQGIEQLKIMHRTHDNDRKTYFDAMLRLYLNADEFNHDAQQIYAKYYNLEQHRTEEMVDRRRLLRYSACTGLGISFIIAIALASIFASGISNRINKLIANCQALGRDQRSSERLSGQDEIKELDDAFHELARIIANASKHERLYIENAGAVVFALDENGRFTSVSPTVMELWGFEVDELISRSIQELAVAKYASRLEQAISNVRESESIEPIEIDLVRNDETQAHVLLSLVWNHWESSIFGVAHDITARKLSQTKMLESEAKQQSILRNVPTGIITVNQSGQIVSMNPWAEMLFETSAQIERGKDVRHLFGPNLSLLLESQQKGNETIETVGTRTSGSFPAQLTICELSAGGHTRMLIVEDLTERLELERKKHEFIATIRSDMRRPLIAARKVLQELQQDESVELNDSGKSSLQAGQRSLRRSIGLINDLLDLESLKTGHVHIERSITNMKSIVAEAADSVAPLAAKKKIDIRADDTSIEISADAERLVQVITNLLSNAIKFSDEGESIEIKIQHSLGFAEVHVVDHGRGIPADRINLVFEKYRQVKESDSARGVGTGLGLTICREIVEAHGGTVGVTSEENIGSTFSVRIPTSGLGSVATDDQSTRTDAESTPAPPDAEAKAT